MEEATDGIEAHCTVLKVVLQHIELYYSSSNCNNIYFSKTIKNFTRFERGIGVKTIESAKDSSADRPTSNGSVVSTDSSPESSLLFKLTMWTLTAAVGAAVIAVQYAVT